MTGTPRDVVFDVVIAASVCAATVLPLTGEPWWIIVCAVLASAPLLWRRRAPLTVMLVVGLATTVLALPSALPRLPYGALVCVYTLTVLSPPVLMWLAIALTAAGVIVSLVIPREELADFGFVGAAYVVAVALGMSARAHRAQVATLREWAHKQEETAAARERVAIARDMHDILTHSVGIMVVQAEAGPLVMRTDPARAEAAFGAIAETGRGAIVQLRRVLGALRSEGGPRPGADSLPDLIAQTRRTGLEVSLEQDGRRRTLPADVDIALYRVVQESLTNTIKHAAARTVRVRLRWAETVLRVEVSDDGRGPRPGGTGGHGMIGMRERVLACGGTLRTGPGPAGAGFAVFATFPIG
ncbi:sensor histidine kinase [Streptosporangium sp. NPDC000396]|uniref:sensor histidine kinase n=1 Tax=Streptosporangium sp. NPDC000396 TaxID=3366185 RepID=UPI00369BFCC4